MIQKHFSRLVLALGFSLAAGHCPRSWAGDTSQPDTPAANDERPQRGAFLERVRSAIDELKLSDDQKTKIDGFFASAREQFRSAADELKDATSEVKTERLKLVMGKLREDVSSVLSDEQKESLRQKLGSGPGSILDRVKAKLQELKLSDEQKKKVQDILEESKAKIQELRSAAAAGGDEAREKLRSAARETREKLDSVLSDTQKEQMKEWWEAHRPGRPAATQP